MAYERVVGHQAVGRPCTCSFGFCSASPGLGGLGSFSSTLALASAVSTMLSCAGGIQQRSAGVAVCMAHAIQRVVLA